MSKNKKNGNMYPWITHTANPLAGECSHDCRYCYVKNLKNRFKVINDKYSGSPRICENGMKKISGSGKFIFVCDMVDLFANAVSMDDIAKILHKCRNYKNKYLFQTKNPKRFFDEIHPFTVSEIQQSIPKNSIVAVTIETNRYYPDIMGDAPTPGERLHDFCKIKDLEKQITIEPILDFDVDEFAEMIVTAKPDQVNIGADSGNNDLPEPEKIKILALATMLKSAGICVYLKNNLERLTK